MSDPSQGSVPTTQGQFAHEDFPFLNDEQWDWVLKLEAVNGRESVLSMLAQGLQTTARCIASFKRYEDSLLTSIRGEMARAAAASQPPAPPPPQVTYIPSPAPSPQAGPKPVRVAVSAFAGEERENLVFWLREIELALSAGMIRDERQRVTFAISNLKGRAKDWALTCETTDPGCFHNWAALQAAMKAMFLPPNVSYRQRVAFLACRQGNRDLYTFVQELRQLRASMAINTLPEEVMVTVLMEGLKPGAARTQLFRDAPPTLDEAIQIALREDYSHRQAQGLPVNAMAAPGATPVGSGPEPMDLSAMDSRAVHVKCYTCQRVGHFQRDCPRNRGFHARGRGRGRGRSGDSGSPRPQGNGHSQ